MNVLWSTYVCPVSVYFITLHSNSYLNFFMISGGFRLTLHSGYWTQQKESASSDIGTCYNELIIKKNNNKALWNCEVFICCSLYCWIGIYWVNIEPPATLEYEANIFMTSLWFSKSSVFERPWCSRVLTFVIQPTWPQQGTLLLFTLFCSQRLSLSVTPLLS